MKRAWFYGCITLLIVCFLLIGFPPLGRAQNGSEPHPDWVEILTEIHRELGDSEKIVIKRDYREIGDEYQYVFEPNNDPDWDIVFRIAERPLPDANASSADQRIEPITFHEYPGQHRYYINSEGIIYNDAIVWVMDGVRFSAHEAPIYTSESVDARSYAELLYETALEYGYGGEQPQEQPSPIPETSLEQQTVPAPTASPTPGNWDLAVRGLTLVQAVEGAQLIAHKPAAVRVFIDWNDPTEVVLADVSLYVDDTVYKTVRQRVKFSYTEEERRTNQDAVVFDLPGEWLDPGEHTFVVQTALQLQSDQMHITEADESNNVTVVSAQFSESSSISLLAQSTHLEVDSADIWRFFQRAQPHLLDVYPLAGVEILPIFPMIRNVIPDTGFTQVVNMAIKRQLYNSQRQPGAPYADYSVGLFPDGHYGEGVYGLSYPISRRNMLVGDGSSNSRAHEALPHEIAHDLLGSLEEYEIAGELEPGFYLPEDALIYKAHTGRLEDLSLTGGRYVNFLGEAGGTFPTWVNQETWQWLYAALGGGSLGMSGKAPLAAPIQYTQPVAEQQVSGYLLAGTLSSDGTAVLDTQLWLNNLATLMGSPPESDIYFQGVDRQGHPLPVLPLDIDFSLADPAPFSAVYPTEEGQVARLNLVVNGEVVWFSEASATPPQVDVDVPTSETPLTGDQNLTWQASDGDGDPLRYYLFYSPHDGHDWLPVGADLSEPSLTVNTDQLPGCDNCRLRVLASDGHHTSAVTSSNHFSVANKPPQVAILAPYDGIQLGAWQPLKLSAFSYDLEDGILRGDQLVWHSDQAGEMGHGAQIMLPYLSPGRHQITVTAQDSRDLTEKAIVTVDVGENISSEAPFGTTLILLLVVCALGAGLLLVVVLGIVLFIRRKKRSRRP